MPSSKSGSTNGPTRSPAIDKTLRKGLRIIDLLSEAGRPLGVSEIAQTLGYTKSTVHRLLQSLCHAGWVLRHPGPREYDLSLRVWEVGAKRLSSLNLRQIGYRHAVALASASEESVHIAVLERMEIVFLEMIDTPKPVRAYTPVGGRAPAHCSATGKAILAFMPAAGIIPLLDGLVRFTNQTITAPERIIAELAQIRRRGFAVNRGEWQQDVFGIAAPVFAGKSRTIVGSIGLSGPANRFGQAAVKRFVPMVTEAAAMISRELQDRAVSAAWTEF